MKPLRKGDVLPYNPPGLVGERIPAVWVPLFVRSQKERAAREILRKQPGVWAWYPDRLVKWKHRGREYSREKAEIGGIIFAKFKRQPHWHKLAALHIPIRPMTIDGGVVILSRETMWRLKGIEKAREEIERAREEHARIVAGDVVVFTEGPLEGHSVAVENVRDGRAYFTGLLGKGSIETWKVVKGG